MTDILKILEDTAVLSHNASLSMDEVAAECKVKRGESLYDRVVECEKRLAEWKRDLDKFGNELNDLVAALDPKLAKEANNPHRTVDALLTVLTRTHDSMQNTYKKVRKEFDGYKTVLRSIKAK
jgi:predicted DNA-binding protein YlxM (UPF0122 family)